MKDINNPTVIQQVQSILGEEDGRELVKLMKNYNKYMARLKSKLDPMIASENLYTAYGLFFKPVKIEEEIPSSNDS
jgi:hypothetical protein